MAAHQLVYHWKHGWIPRDHIAALQKAHGSHKGAARIMQKHGITPPGGHHSEPHPAPHTLKAGEHATVRGVDHAGNPITLTGKVTGNSESAMFSRHRTTGGTPMRTIAVERVGTSGMTRTDHVNVPDSSRGEQRRQSNAQTLAAARGSGNARATEATSSTRTEGPTVVGTLAHHNEIVTVAKTNGKHRVKIDGRNHGGPHDTHEAALAEAHTLVPPHRRATTEEDARAKALEINRQAEAERIAKVRAQADAAKAAETQSGDARVQIDHSGDGTLLHIDRSDTEARAAAKAAGFKWSSNLGSWYLPRNWSESTRRSKIHQLQDKLGHGNVHVADAGHGMTTTAAEREAAMRARAADRATRMDARSAKAAQEAESRRAASDRITDLIPMGQPILVGHHSEGRHRRDIARSHSHMEKSWEADKQAKEAARSAEIARQTAAGDSPLLRQRRIDRNEAEVRSIDRTLEHHDLAVKLTATKPEAAAKIGIRPLAPEHHSRLKTARAELVDQIAHDKAQIAASGHQAVTAEQITPGDVVQYRGRTHVVKKVNKTTVAVPTGYSWDDKVPINQISKHIKLADLPVSAIRSALASEKDPKIREHFVRELNRRGLHVTP